jgi:hypothetical protein
MGCVLPILPVRSLSRCSEEVVRRPISPNPMGEK